MERHYTADDFYNQRVCVPMIPKFEEKENQLLLKIGDKIMNNNHIVVDGIVGTIVEFKRGIVVCTNGLSFYPKDNDYSIDFYYILRNGTWHEIKETTEIFIQQNPLMTCDLRNKIHEVALARHKKSVEKVNAVTAELGYHPGVTVRNYVPARYEQPNIPEGYKFTCIHIDNLYDGGKLMHTSGDTFEDTVQDKKGRIKCFICGKKLYWKFAIDIKSDRVSLLFKDHHKSHKTTISNLYKHCETNNHALFHFTVKEVFDDGGQTTFLQIQKSMSRALSITTNNNIPFQFFKFMSEGKPTLLIHRINLVMGAAIACNKLTKINAKRMIQGFDKEGVTMEIFNSYIEYCDWQLHNIAKCLSTFNYTELLEFGVSCEEVWNATNLFLKQGLYFVSKFVPVHQLNIKNITLDRNFPTDWKTV